MTSQSNNSAEGNSKGMTVQLRVTSRYGYDNSAEVDSKGSIILSINTVTVKSQ